MNVFNKILCKENIKLEPKFITNNFKDEIRFRLKRKVEGICTKHGYIKHDSVEIYKITPGIIELTTLSGHVVYTVYFYADICNPVIGSIIKTTITNINRFGILTETGYKVGNTNISVLEIIIAKNSINIQSDIDLELLKIGDELIVEIIGKKFELGEKKMLGIGRVVKDITIKNIKNDNIDTIIQEPEEDDEIYDKISDSDDDEEKDEKDEKEDENDDEDDEDIKGGSEFFSDDENFFSDEEEEDADIDDADENLSIKSSENDLNINDD